MEAILTASSGLVKVVSVADGLAFERERLSSGILFSAPSWSGPARARLRDLIQAIGSLARPRSEPLVYVFENDDPEWYERMFGQPLHGWGETFWVRHGKIVHAHTTRDDGACPDVEARTLELLGA